MKKNDVLKAIDKKNISSSKKKGNNSTSKSKNTKKNKNTAKKKPTSPVKDNLILVDSPSSKPIEVVKREEKKVEKEKKIEKEKPMLTPKQKLIRFAIKLGIFLVIIVVLILVFLAVTEYKPKAKEKLEVNGEGYHDLEPNSTFTIMTWNIGYGALGDNADYFKDGGKMVKSADRIRLNKNIKNIQYHIEQIKPNIFFLQEVDKYSKRANHVNELSYMGNHFVAYNYSYARNLKVTYLPYPIPNMIGSVDSGIATFTKYNVKSAERIGLPESYMWPFSMANYKRALQITRIPVKDTEKELVLINVHMEEYAKDEKRNAQTEKLIELIQKENKKENYIIVGGDFSQTFSNIDKKKYPQQEHKWAPGTLDVSKIKGDWQFLMDGEIPTSRSLDQPYTEKVKEKFQYYLIDGYIVSKNIQVNEVKTQDYGFVASDHNPVVLNVTLQ